MDILCTYVLTSPFGEQSTNSGIFNATTYEMQSLESLHAALIEKILSARQWDKTEAERITVVNIQTEKSLLCKSAEGESMNAIHRILALLEREIENADVTKRQYQGICDDFASAEDDGDTDEMLYAEKDRYAWSFYEERLNELKEEIARITKTAENQK